MTKVFYQSYPRLLFLLYTHYNPATSIIQARVCHFMNWHITGCFYVSMEYSRNVNVIPPLMEIGDRVQTLNTFVPITGEIVDMYKNLVTIADDDAETVDQLLSFHADDLEVIS